MEFNNAQREAVNHFKGAAMVLAGPGSGKTTVITHRIKELIRKDVSPEKILVVTFTKAAAVHMQRKFFQIMEGEHWFSFCLLQRINPYKGLPGRKSAG